jgi:hypothetical protein
MMNDPRVIPSCLDELRNRELHGGGVSNRPGGGFRPDATAWSILALSAVGKWPDMIERCRSRLSDHQLPDGRVSLSRDHPEAYWPTPLAAIAWHGSPRHRESQALAIQFLLSTSGRHFEVGPDAAVSHDTSIRGWAWISETHSMIEPTALSVMALTVSGHGKHDRAREAVRMVLDRQLPKGGWNYGNTLVYGQELYPQPGYTGLALCALAGKVPKEHVLNSLKYLNTVVPAVRTPFSLGWTLLGLRAWGIRSPKYRPWILGSLKRQDTYGTYDTSNLSILLLAFSPKADILWSANRKNPKAYSGKDSEG